MREKREAIEKIVNIKYYCRRAICKLSFPWKEPEGSPEVAVKRWFALAVLFPYVKESHFGRFMGTIVFISDIQKLNWRFGVFVSYWVCFEKGS